MEQLRDIIIDYNAEIIIGLMVAFLVVLILYLIEQFRVGRITEKYNALVKDVEGINLEELILESLKEIEEVRADTEKLEKTCSELDSRLKYAIQKVGIIRYNAFADMGSELSFSLALLDDSLNGVVITSIFGREYTTSYGKPIIEGKSKYPLSVEEMQAIDRAIYGEDQIMAH